MRISLWYIIFLITVFTSKSYSQEFYLGVDLSYVNELEDNNVVYYNDEGTQQDVYEIFGNKGANLVRYRLWHNPQWTNYSNFTDVSLGIERSKAQNLNVLLDFHYSDFWADPSRQWCPEAWNAITDDKIMGDSVYSYTYNTLKVLANKGLLPEMVQIGNETNGNILITRNGQNIDASSPGMSPINWTRQVSLFHRGIEAVKQINNDFSVEIKTVIHIAQPEKALWWFRDAIANGLEDFDIIGMSYYPQWSSMNIRELAETVKFLNETYQKNVMLVEVGYPYTTSGDDNAGNVLGNDSKEEIFGNTISKEVQQNFMIELCYLVKQNGGIGVVYWEPAWVSSNASTYWGKGSHYENATLFDFDNKLHNGATFLSYDYSQTPEALTDKTVTLKVNMQGQETQNGVFVTGTFTGENWEFIEMNDEGENWYSASTLIPGRSIGGYIFYNHNIWDNLYKETVPSSCAKMWNTHRQYIVIDSDEEYSNVWSSCSNIPVGIHDSKEPFSLYPIPASNYLIIKGIDNIEQVIVFNSIGQNVSCELNSSNHLDINSLKPGQYYVIVQSDKGKNSQIFIKK